jgi:hypothetical protein
MPGVGNEPLLAAGEALDQCPPEVGGSDQGGHLYALWAMKPVVVRPLMR